MKIAIHGAVGAGKAALTTALANALTKRGGDTAHIALSPPIDSTSWDCTLLCGLDWSDGESAIDSSLRERYDRDDAQLRNALMSIGAAFQVVYGVGDVWVSNAIKAIDAANGNLMVTAPSTAQGNAPTNVHANDDPKWRWDCEKCGDSSCEHRLFSELIR